jgi:hypothetical protein
MPTYRIVYGDDEQVIRETFTDVEVQREDGWVVLFRGKEAILRMREEHVQSLDEVTGEEGWATVSGYRVVARDERWPALPLADWHETRDTLAAVDSDRRQGTDGQHSPVWASRFVEWFVE